MANSNPPVKVKARERILLAAEKAFSSEGFDKPSLRDITAAAKVNLASVSYYFGSRDGLVEAIILRSARRWNEQRVQRLNICLQESGGAPVPIENLVACAVDPVLEELSNADDGGAYLGSLLSRSLNDPGEAFPKELGPTYRVVMEKFETEVGRSLPHLNAKEIHWRLFFGVGSMLRLFAHGQMLTYASGGRSGAPDCEWIRRELIRFIAGGLEAPALQELK